MKCVRISNRQIKPTSIVFHFISVFSLFLSLSPSSPIHISCCLTGFMASCRKSVGCDPCSPLTLNLGHPTMLTHTHVHTHTHTPQPSQPSTSPNPTHPTSSTRHPIPPYPLTPLFHIHLHLISLTPSPAYSPSTPFSAYPQSPPCSCTLHPITSSHDLEVLTPQGAGKPCFSLS